MITNQHHRSPQNKWCHFFTTQLAISIHRSIRIASGFLEFVFALFLQLDNQPVSSLQLGFVLP